MAGGFHHQVDAVDERGTVRQQEVDRIRALMKFVSVLRPASLRKACLALCFRSCSSSEAPGLLDLGKRQEAYARSGRTVTVLPARRCLSWALHN